jgi:hypothetical protein
MEKMPSGRFWMGKSQPGVLALATQLVRLGAWVWSIGKGRFLLICRHLAHLAANGEGANGGRHHIPAAAKGSRHGL